MEMFSTDVIEAHQQFSPADNYVAREGEAKAKKRRMKL